jgi:hypothetical protein
MLDVTSFTAALKQHYVDFTVKDMAYQSKPLHALLRKDEKFTGLNLPLPLRYGNPQNRSAVFATAQAGTSNVAVSQFLLTRKSDYSIASIQNEVLEASQGDSASFLSAATTQIDGAIASLSASIATAEYRNGSGSICQVGSVASNTITLKNIAEIAMIERNMVLQANATDGGTPRAGTMVVTSVDRNLGTFTCSGGVVSGVAANDFLLVSGDLNAKIHGLDGWIPMPGTLTSTAFLGLDRTADATRLAGVSKDYTGAPIDQAMTNLSSAIGREGGKPDYCFLDFENYAALENALGSKVQYVNVKASDVDVGFEGIRVHGTKGPIQVVPDQNCQADRFYMLQLDTWALYSLGMAPKLFKGDSLDMLRSPTADALDLRVLAYLEMGCVAPGYNGVAKIV